MAHSPSHRPTKSISSKNLQPPTSTPMQKQRRMTSPASQSSLNLPEGQRQQPGRPPSPLRNGFVPDTFTGIDHDDSSEDEDDFQEHGRWTERSPSPSSSVSQLAANFAQRVGSFVGMVPRSPGGMLTDAELEAEAERERDRSRKEAERILTREAQERKLVEERVLAMMESTRGLPPPPSRSQTMPNPPSPSSSQKDNSNWWTTAKNKLTPTKDKEPLTPAQQVIQEAKTREKDKKGKGKEKEKDWPASTQGKYNDPALLNLKIPVASPQRKPVPTSPSSPTPSRPNLSNLPPNLTPSPMRGTDAASSSPSREAPPLYAQFNSQGTLDVAGTVLTIAKRFEKLEKWTVGHVRALEDRMSDVERWLVDKEKEKEETASLHKESDTSIPASVTQDLHDIKGDLSELQGRVGELGREMAKLATAPSNLSSGPSREPAPVSVAPQTTSSIAVHSERALSPPPVSTPHHSRLVSVTARESTSPPIASSKSAAGTRLPYPTGDYYATPPDSSILSQGTFSPPHSPPSSVTSATRTLPLSAAGIGLGISAQSTPSSSYSSSTSYPQRATSPPVSARAVSPPAQGLPPPKAPSIRQSSISPTPRKRYTVALGGPIVAPPELSDEPQEIRSQTSVSSLGKAYFSSAPAPQEKYDDEDNEFQDETIGKSFSAKFTNAANANDPKTTPSPSPSSNRRLRARSAYGFANIQGSQTLVAPLQTPSRLRARSIDRLGPAAAENATLTGAAGGKFVDPLVLRKQDKEGAKVAMPKPVGKVPIGQLVAFFDGEKRA
ncbi:hypothetical protein BDZ94DRAFT_1203948 [Collybia nuda]|uniref:Uncharacterized protein n=1 Tax=Collybia nuda TaxID=64659 RepID=A0A9P6C8Y1_9AGAR|nr:hypothetical protein BDZ94DRAFT_1203948 [Collybia nuda]